MIKSPLNYIGGKYRLLPQMLPLFPSAINTFVDLFVGGLDVSLNVKANRIVCNDINHYVIGLFDYFKHHDSSILLHEIHQTIEVYNLSKQNENGYYALRSEYNRSRNPLHLFLLVCFGFNHQIRFNNKGDFNNPFGKNRSSYNPNTERNLKQMHERVCNYEFNVMNFKDFDTRFMQHGDFLYADPPYLISCGTYNDGKRGFEGWNANDDHALYEKLDDLNSRGINFALSNVIQHKGTSNEVLRKWAEKYNMHYLTASYANSNYQAKESETIEVLITNY